MKPYSQDLRDRVLHALEADAETQSDVAERFWISLSFVEKLWQRWRRSGSCGAQPHAGGKPGALKDHTEVLRREVAHQPDATPEALRERVAAANGPRVSPATICRDFQRLMLPRLQGPTKGVIIELLRGNTG